MDLKTSKHIRERVHDNISESENYNKPDEYIVLNARSYFLYLLRFIFIQRNGA